MQFWLNQCGIETKRNRKWYRSVSCFDWTSVELKPNTWWSNNLYMSWFWLNQCGIETRCDKISNNPYNSVLIEPVWNWNLGSGSANKNLTLCFDWTSVELKHVTSPSEKLEILGSFDWTSVELKPVWVRVNRFPFKCFDWTSVELKQESKMAN